MKKKYTAPGIIFESFSLSAAVTSNCNYVVNTISLDMCGVQLGNQYVFFDSMSFCKNGMGFIPVPLPKEAEEFNGLCYHNPTDANRLFNS
jgi:hypothetical protein